MASNSSPAFKPTFSKLIGIFAVLSFTINCYVLSTIIKRWIEKKRNPYLKPIFEDSDDYKEAYKRVEINIEKNNLETTEPLDVNE